MGFYFFWHRGQKCVPRCVTRILRIFAPQRGQGFAGLLIHVVPHLKTSLPPVDIDVIRNRRAAGLDGFAKHLADGRVQLLDPVRSQPHRDGQWMNSGAEQRFVRIDISDAAHETSD